ncbi:MAG: hypothetical protein MJ061_03620 [Mailhella sp.]|nr:hypothetical protein [Mailhella sp.]
MLRSIIVLIVMGVCALYLYRMQDSADTAPERRITRDTSGISRLEGTLPKVFFEKEIAPLIKANEAGGLTAAQCSGLAEKLRGMAEHAGRETGRGIQEALRKFAPEEMKGKATSGKTSSGRPSSPSASESDMAARISDLGRYAEIFINGLITTFSRILELAAEQLRK